MTTILPSATHWKNNPYRPEWSERDYFHLGGTASEVPDHPCKRTYLISRPFIRSFRNAVDVGCRFGEYTRYLQLDFNHVYAFDPRRLDKFRFNVDLAKVTHFTAALGDEAGEIQMYKGGHAAHANVAPSTVPMFPLDDFDLADVDYIKIDVEGFEKKVLLGAARTIERNNPLIVIEQNHVVLQSEKQYAAKSYLESLGYRQVAVDERGWDFVMVRQP